MKPLPGDATSPMPTNTPSFEIRMLAEMHSIQTTLVRLTEIMARISETLERAKYYR